jgi:NAD(P)-dependent dehydrogenase (short-subunit alcohol dehydrogenase family)
MGRLEGKSAVVLGAAGLDNMGQVIARRLASEGARVLVAGRDRAALASLASEIDGAVAVCDIAKRSDSVALAQAAMTEFGGVDIAVNATGWGYLSAFLDMTEADLRKITDLQFIGPVFFYQAMVAAMVESGGGSLIQISSATATIMLNDHAAYMGSKAGADHIIRCIAHEFGAQGVRANSISPGLTSTPMTAAAAVPGLFDAFLPCYPLGRIGTSEDVAEAVVFLASDHCFMTGQNLQVNGGLTLRRNPSREEIATSVAAAAHR